ncbi:hypothetical protein Pfo_015339 [Paulownia fortunei]|nr:hypothetical protein Pfo_015339 [Paulownia fortunei]
MSANGVAEDERLNLVSNDILDRVGSNPNLRINLGPNPKFASEFNSVAICYKLNDEAELNNAEESDGQHNAQGVCNVSLDSITDAIELFEEAKVESAHHPSNSCDFNANVLEGVENIEQTKAAYNIQATASDTESSLGSKLAILTTNEYDRLMALLRQNTDTIVVEPLTPSHDSELNDDFLVVAPIDESHNADPRPNNTLCNHADHLFTNMIIL